MPRRTMPLDITVEPLDDRRCKFFVSRPVVEPGVVRKYGSLADAGDSAVAQAVLEVPGVCDVVVSSNVITVGKSSPDSWEALAPRVRYAIETAVAMAAAPGAPPRPNAAMDDDAMYELVTDLFRDQINPAVAQHGGRVDLIDVQEGMVVLRMMGGCQGCGMANVTLRQGIEASLRREIPGFAGIRDITDHASGRNPYFTAGSK